MYEKNIYRGVWLVTLIVALFPFASNWAFKEMLTNFGSLQDTTLIKWEAVTFAGLVSTLLILGFVLATDFSKHLMIVVNRIKEFVYLVKMSKRVAFSCYAFNVKQNGVVFWIYIAYIAYALTWLIYGVKNFLILYVG